MTASIQQINISDGGLPKLAVDAAFINVRGVLRDQQGDRRYHGSPDQALCLYSSEVIAALQAEGHPIEAGSVGENLTLSGIDWATIEPGQKLRIGDSVLAEITFPATPCAKTGRWFTDRAFNRVHNDEHPGWSRWYAKILAGGPIAQGDKVEIVTE